MERFSQYINKQSAEHHMGYDSFLFEYTHTHTHTHIIITIIIINSSYSGCYHKILVIRQLKQQKFISHSLEPRGQRSKCWPIQSLVRAPDAYLLITSSQAKERRLWPFLLFLTRTLEGTSYPQLPPKGPMSQYHPTVGEEGCVRTSMCAF